MVQGTSHFLLQKSIHLRWKETSFWLVKPKVAMNILEIRSLENLVPLNKALNPPANHPFP